MNVVRHHDIGMELVVSEILISIVDGVDHHACNLGPPQEERAGDSKIENAIHGEEGSSGGGHRGEGAIRRQAAMQTPGEEDGLADGMIMRQPATMEGGHEEKVGVWGKDSHESRWGDCQSPAG